VIGDRMPFTRPATQMSTSASMPLAGPLYVPMVSAFAIALVNFSSAFCRQARSIERFFLSSPGGDPSYDPDCQRTAF